MLCQLAVFSPKQEKFCKKSSLVALNNFTPLSRLWWFRPQWDQQYWCQNLESFILIFQEFNVLLRFQDFNVFIDISRFQSTILIFQHFNVLYWGSKILIDSMIHLLFILRLQDFNVSYGDSQEDEIQSGEGCLLSGRYGQCKFLVLVNNWFKMIHNDTFLLS